MPGPRSSRPATWIRWRTVLLVLVLLLPGTPEVVTRLYAEKLARERLTAHAAPGRNTLPSQRTSNQAAPPSPSGAYPPYPLNHSFDADIVRLPGSPTNYDFEAEAYEIGSPPTNYDFETTPTDTGAPSNGDFASGSFTNWTILSGSPTIGTTGGPDGNYGRMGSGVAIETQPFVVSSDAHELIYDYGLLSTSGTVRLYVDIAVGPSYTWPSSHTATYSCSGCNQWRGGSLEVTDYLGQSIKVRFTRDAGTVGVDRVRTRASFPGWTPTGKFEYGKAGTNTYAKIIDATFTSSAFTVGAAAQFALMSIRAEDSSNGQYRVFVLSGTGYGTSTEVAQAGVGSSFEVRRVNLQNWQGQSIKLKIEDAYGGRVGVDSLGFQVVDVPNWKIPNGTAKVSDGQGGTALRFGGNLTSEAFTIPVEAQQFTFRYRVSDMSGTAVEVELLRGPTFSTVTGMPNATGSSGVWKTYRKVITDYAGETVKIRFRPQLQDVYVDDAVILQDAVPGWTLSQSFGAAFAGRDRYGTYIGGEGGSIGLTSSLMDPGVVDRTSSHFESRSFVLRAAHGGTSNTGSINVWWVGANGSSRNVFSNTSSSATPVTNFRFTLDENLPTPGRFRISVTGSAKIYSIADNVARQQLSEPFSQQAGSGIDTSTGSFGTSETDLAIQGGPLPLVFTRYYHGHSDRFGELGFRWSHSFNTYLGIYGGDVSVVFGSGKEEFFRSTGSGTYAAADVRVKSTLTKYTSPPDGVDYRYRTKDNLIYNFEGDGDLISIVDANGNAITLYRDPVSELITSIEDPGGRSLDLSYDVNGRLATVAGPDGAEVNYLYDQDGDLVAVQKPEGAQTEYVYSKHRLTTILQRQGDDLVSSRMVPVLTNTLDEYNRVVTQASATTATDRPIVVEAESYVDSIARNDQAWEERDDIAGFAGNGFLRPEPVDANAYTSGFATASPQLDYTIDFPVAGTYYVWVRGWADDGDTDSLHVGLDGVEIPDATAISYFSHDTWSWAQWTATDRAMIEVDSPGTHRVNVWMREDGFRFDRLILTTDPDFEPTTVGPDENVPLPLRLVAPLVIDAESYVQDIPRGSQGWEVQTDVAGFAGTGFMRAEPVTANAYTSGYATASPELAYTIDFPAAGTYYVWVRGYADNGDMDSVHVGLDGTEVASGTAIGSFGFGAWAWAQWTPIDRATVEVDSAGIHTLNVWMREDGFRLDRILLTPDPAYTPTDLGPVEHIRSLPIADPDAPTVTFGYLTGASQGVTRVTDPLGEDTDFYFDDYARTTHVETPSGDVTQWFYDNVGNLETMIDPATNEYEIAYNADADPTSITDPLGNPTAITWDTVKHLPTQIIDARGGYTVNTYDSAGNLIQTVVDAAKDALGNTIPGTHVDKMTVYVLDSEGRVISETVDPATDALGNPRAGTRLDLMTRYSYDVEGNKTSIVIDPALDAAGIARGGTHLDLTWSWTYNGRGLVTTATDPNGHVTTYIYDGLGRLQRERRVRNGINEDTDYVFDFSNNLLLYEDPLDRQWTWTYDTRNLPLTKTDPLGKTWHYAYDDAGQLVSETDPLGIVTAYSYDDDGRLIRITNDAGETSHLNLVTAFTYDDAGRLASETVDPTDPNRPGDELNLATTYTYDEAGLLIGKELPNGGVWTYDYDDVGQLISQTDPLLHTTSYEYDKLGRLVTITDPLGHEKVYGYDTAGRQTSTGRVLNGSTTLTTTSTYDAANRVLTETDPLNHTTAYSYDDAGNLANVKDAANQYTYFEYDELNHLVEITDPLQRVTTITYDAAGQQIASTQPSGLTTTTEYDDRGFVTAVIVPLDQTTDLVTSYDYDDVGRRIATTNPRGFTMHFGYDAVDRLTTITDAATPAGVVSIAYDAAGRATSVTNPRGYTSESTYDELGNLLTTTDALDRTRTSTYNLAGLLTQTTDARGTVVKYVYDDANRLTSLRDENDVNYVVYGYDNADRRTSMTDATGSTSWSYNADSLVTSVTSPQGTIDYTYDVMDRRETMTLPGSRTATYDYDVAGQLTSLEDWQSRETTFTYKSDGMIASVTRPNGVTSAYDYDGADRLVAMSHFDPNSVPLAEYAYELDENGNRASVEITGTAVTNGIESYVYDELDRLTSVTYPNSGGTIAYTYDANGNRATRTSGSQVTSYVYDVADQLTETTGAEVHLYDYDENGNRVSVDANTFAYDWRDRLTEATVDSTTVGFAYDGDDTRSSKTVGSTTTDYLWDRENDLPQLVDDETAAYLDGATGIPTAIDTSHDAVYPLVDGLGSNRAETDGAGAVTSTADYDVFGGTRAQSGTQGAFGWTGEQQDAETGLTYLRARYYSPGSGRFLTPDSVNPSAPGTQGYNRYSYVGNNPATMTDPSGHSGYRAELKAIAQGVGTGFVLRGAIQGALPFLTGVVAPLLLGLLIVLVVLMVVQIIAVLMGWCEAHGLRTCFGEWRAGISVTIEGGRRTVTTFAADVKRAVANAWDAIPRPWSEPNTGPWQPVPPAWPRSPERPRTAEPRAETRPRTRDRAEPIDRTRRQAPDSCRLAVASNGWQLPPDRRQHIEDRHGPNAPWPQTPPNGTFTQTAWAVLDLLIGLTLTTPTFTPSPQGARCKFVKDPVGLIRTGVDQERTRVLWGMTVIYTASIGDYYTPGTVVTAFPSGSL